jgi:hypothetical protein
MNEYNFIGDDDKRLGLITRRELELLNFYKKFNMYIMLLPTHIVGLRCDETYWEKIKFIGSFNNEINAFKATQCWIANNVFFDYQYESCRNDPIAFQLFNSRLVDSDEYCFSGYSYIKPQKQANGHSSSYH